MLNPATILITSASIAANQGGMLVAAAQATVSLGNGETVESVELTLRDGVDTLGPVGMSQIGNTNAYSVTGAFPGELMSGTKYAFTAELTYKLIIEEIEISGLKSSHTVVRTAP